MNPIYEYPIRNLVPNLVYSARGSEIESVIIDGRFVIEDRELLTGNEEHITEEVNEAANRIAGEMGKLAWARELPLVQWTRDGYY